MVKKRWRGVAGGFYVIRIRDPKLSEWSNHLKNGHNYVQILNVSGLWRLGLDIRSLLYYIDFPNTVPNNSDFGKNLCPPSSQKNFNG
jgi:hypothetical protein